MHEGLSQAMLFVEKRILLDLLASVITCAPSLAINTLF
jgi:hypothetical protein